jgi:nucleoside triphosphate diphosphatase
MAIQHLLEIMRRLRDPANGCPWDVAQDFASIAPYTLEEAYEVVDAIASQRPEAIREELGDLLLQVVFHAQMASERAWFDFNDVAQGIVEKMLRRHPHVFGDEDIGTAEEQSQAWEKHKAAERAAKGLVDDNSVLAGVPLAMPALTRAVKLQKKAAKVGFDWPSLEPVFDKLHEEINEVHDALARQTGQDALEDEIGDVLFVCANLARHLKIDPETAVRRANAKFERRFRGIETILRERGKSVETATLEEMDRIWDEMKARERDILN